MVSLDRPSIDVIEEPPGLRPYSTADFEWAMTLLGATGGRYRVRRGNVVDVAMLPGLVAERQGQPMALLTMAKPATEQLEISVVAAMPFAPDLVAMLLSASGRYADPQCRRIFSICSNAEFEVQRALQSNGFRLAAARPGAIDIAAGRSSLPVHREFAGLAMTDELEFERLLSRS